MSVSLWRFIHLAKKKEILPCHSAFLQEVKLKCPFSNQPLVCGHVVQICDVTASGAKWLRRHCSLLVRNILWLRTPEIGFTVVSEPYRYNAIRCIIIRSCDVHYCSNHDPLFSFIRERRNPPCYVQEAAFSSLMKYLKRCPRMNKRNAILINVRRIRWEKKRKTNKQKSNTDFLSHSHLPLTDFPRFQVSMTTWNCLALLWRHPATSLTHAHTNMCIGTKETKTPTVSCTLHTETSDVVV